MDSARVVGHPFGRCARFHEALVILDTVAGAAVRTEDENPRHELELDHQIGGGEHEVHGRGGCEFYIMRAPYRRCYAVRGWGRAESFWGRRSASIPSHN